MPEHTKNSVTEYYKVNTLENYNEVCSACRFFSEKYGKIDWIESENEYWLETEAKLRSEFDVNSGNAAAYAAENLAAAVSAAEGFVKITDLKIH